MLLAGLFAILAYFTRPGIILFWGIITLWAVSYNFFQIRENWRERVGLLVVSLVILISMAISYLLFLYQEIGEVAITGRRPLNSIFASIYTTATFNNTEHWVNFLKHFPEAFSIPFFVLFLFFIFKRFKEGFTSSEVYLIFILVGCSLTYLLVLPERRYLTHIMPMALIFPAMGFCYIEQWLKTRAREKFVLVSAVLILAIVAFQLPKGMVALHAHRMPERLAGSWLKEHEGRSHTIMARSPIVAYYADSYHVPMLSSRLKDVIEYGAENNVEYMVGYTSRLSERILDFDMEKGRFLKEVKSFKAQREDEFIIYRFSFE
jgi:hypothetical protein